MSGRIPKSVLESTNTHHPRLESSPNDPKRLGGTLETLLAAARPRLMRSAQRQGVPLDAADDVVQETLVEAWRHLDALRNADRFDSWLNGICRNVSLRWLRAQGLTTTHQIHLPHLGDEYEGDNALELALTDPATFDPAEELSRQDMTILLDRAMGFLPTSTRKAVELYYLAELPQREAAQCLGMTIHALEERLYRARRQLRQVLTNELRAEAEMFGLLAGQETESAWRETRELCRFCGQHRQRGVLKSQANGLGFLQTCCPSCSVHYGNTNTSEWQPELYGVHSFRPALKRIELKMKSFMLSALADRGAPCHVCGRQARIRIVPPHELYGDFTVRFPIHALLLECPWCGACRSMWACGAIFWFHRAPNDFIERYPHWIAGPEAVVDYKGQIAIRFCLLNPSSTAKLIVLAHAQTLQVLATFQE